MEMYIVVCVCVCVCVCDTCGNTTDQRSVGEESNRFEHPTGSLRLFGCRHCRSHMATITTRLKGIHYVPCCKVRFATNVVQIIPKGLKQPEPGCGIKDLPHDTGRDSIVERQEAVLRKTKRHTLRTGQVRPDCDRVHGVDNNPSKDTTQTGRSE